MRRWDFESVIGVRGDGVLGEAFVRLRGYLNVIKVRIFCVDFELERTD